MQMSVDNGFYCCMFEGEMKVYSVRAELENDGGVKDNRGDSLSKNNEFSQTSFQTSRREGKCNPLKGKSWK